MRTTRAFRVFVSSTFEDFALERDALARVVARELRRFCLTRGVDFQLVDLRCGVSRLLARNQRTLEVCLNEIDRTSALRAKPSFLILLGERYGWIPLPHRIQRHTFEQIIDHLRGEPGLELLRSRYRLDLNSVPPTYELTVPGRLDQDDGFPDQNLLRTTLERGIQAASLVDDPAVADFFWSATHHEIERAISRVPGDHVVSCFRSLKYVSPDDEKKFREQSEESKLLLARLRDRVGELAGAHIHQIFAEVRNGTINSTYLNYFIDRVTTTLKTLVTEQLDSAPPMSEKTEGSEHFARSQTFTSSFVARKQALIQLQSLAEEATGQTPVFLSGPSGSGKTTLIAATATDLRNKQPERIVIERFIGTTPGSVRTFPLLLGVAHQLRRILDIADPPVPPVTISEAIQQLQQALQRATAEQSISLFFDGLNQLEDNEPVDWLRDLVFPHVSIVWSSLSGPAGITSSNSLILESLTATEAGEILAERMRESRRTLTHEQRARIAGAIQQASSPLYVEIAFQVVRHWRSWDEGSNLPSDLGKLLTYFFDQLRLQDHGPLCLDYTLALLVASRHGLSETELLDLLSMNHAVMEEFAQLHPRSPTTDRLAAIVLSRLLAAIDPFLATRGLQGSRLIGFFHGAVADFVAKQYLAARPVHTQLVDYFVAQPSVIADSEGTGSRLNTRKLSELPMACIRSGDWERLAALLNDFAFLMAKAEAHLANELPVDVEAASRSPVRESVMEVSKFMARSGASLRVDSEAWPAHRVLLQTAIDQLPEAPLQARAQAFLESGSYQGLWLRPAWPEIPDGIICKIDAGASIIDVSIDEDDYVWAVLSGNRRKCWSLRTGLSLPEPLPVQGNERDHMNEPENRSIVIDGWRVSIDDFSVVMHRNTVGRLTIEKHSEDSDSDKQEQDDLSITLPERKIFLQTEDQKMQFPLGSGKQFINALSNRQWAVWDDKGQLAIWDLDESIRAAESRQRLPAMAMSHVGGLNRLTNLTAVSHGLHGEFNATLSLWDCRSGVRLAETTLPYQEKTLGDFEETVNEFNKKSHWVTGSTTINNLVVAWGRSAVIAFWHPRSQIPLRTCAIKGQFEILDAEPFWYSPAARRGVSSTSRERHSGEHLVFAILTSHGVNVLYDATTNTGHAVYQSRMTRFPPYARRYEMFGFDVLADGRLARRFCGEYPMIYDLGKAFAAPETYRPIVLQGNWDSSSPSQDPTSQVRKSMVLASGQFVTLRGDEIVAYDAEGSLLRIWNGHNLLQLPDQRLLIFGPSPGVQSCGAIYDLDESINTLTLCDTASPIVGATSFLDHEILTWHEDDHFRLWDTTSAKLLDICPQADAWHRRPTWVQAKMAVQGSVSCLDWSVWQSPSMIGLQEVASRNSIPGFAAFYSGIQSQVLWLEPDGTLVLLQDGIQPRVVQLFRGQGKVDLITARGSSSEVDHFEPAPEAIHIMAEESLRASDLLMHLIKTDDEHHLNLNLATLDEISGLLEKSSDASLDGLRVRTSIARALARFNLVDFEGALSELRKTPVAKFVDQKSSAEETRHRCIYVSLLLVNLYLHGALADAALRDEVDRLYEAQTGLDLVSMLDDEIDRCDSDHKWEAILCSQGIALAILFERDRLGGADPAIAIAAWGKLKHINKARDAFDLIKSATDKERNQRDRNWWDTHFPSHRALAETRTSFHVPSPHPAADPEKATRLNVAYQKDLAAWQSLPFFRRLFTKKPKPPEGI